MLVSLLVALAGATGFVAPPDGLIQLRSAWAAPATSGGDARIYLTIVNLGMVPFAVLETTSELADSVVSNGLGAEGPGGAPMRSAFAVMPKKVLAMVPDGRYLVLKGLKRDLKAGDTFVVRLRCLGDLKMAVEVVVKRPVPAGALGKEA